MPATYRILQPGDEAVLESFLLPQLESSMFLLSNMRQSGLIDGDERAHGVYAARSKAISSLASWLISGMATSFPKARRSTLVHCGAW